MSDPAYSEQDTAFLSQGLSPFFPYLVYGAWNEAAHVFLPAEDVWEAVWEAGGGLGGREGDFTDVV